jgi:diacylglycerol kinase family enzyme
MQIGVITNPNSRKNKGRPDRARKLQAIVGRHGEVHATDSVDSIKPILREFLRRRARYWVADGGDGALHWVVRNGLELLEEPEFRGGNFQLPTTLPTNGGTIDFVANNVGITGQAEGLLEDLRSSVESGTRIEEVEVDSMLIEGIEINEFGEEVSFRTYGFASAVGGLGQRFFTKYYAAKDPSPQVIMKVVGNTIASIPLSFSPLSKLPMLPVPKHLRTYAKEMFEPAHVRVSLDGQELSETRFTGVHIASMSLNLGGVFKLFNEADVPGQMHAIVGSPTPMQMMRNLPKMYRGKSFEGPAVADRACKGMTVEVLGHELLAPIIDGEYYRNVKKLVFSNGPSLRIPKLTPAT